MKQHLPKTEVKLTQISSKFTYNFNKTYVPVKQFYVPAKQYYVKST